MCGLLLTCLFWLAPADARAERAKSADTFVESAGVNVHIYFGGVYEDYDAWKPKLVALGVRYIRDGLSVGLPSLYTRLNDLADSGVKADLIMGDPKNKYGTGTLDQLVSTLKTKVLSAVVSVEGPNEWDTNAGTYPCDPARADLGCWATDLRTYQEELYNKVNGDPALANLAVVGPAFALGDNRPVGDLSQWLDFGNMHPYPNNRNPEWSLDPGGGDEFGRAAVNSGDHPVIATETGYHNAVQSSEGHRPVSERASGIYVPRLLLDYFERVSGRGQTVKRSFLYELIDTGTSLTSSEQRFGLLRNDLSEKPAYKSLKNLLALLEDRGPPFDPGSLDYSLEGATPDIRSLLLEKRDGSFWLALWREVDVWNESSGGDLHPSDQQVTVRLAKPVAHASVYRPGVSASAQQSWTDTSEVQLGVPADVVLLRLGRDIGPNRAGDAPAVGCTCATRGEGPNAHRPSRLKLGVRRFQLDLGRTRRARRITIHWPAARHRRYRVSTAAGRSKFRRAGQARLGRRGRDMVRFRLRRVRCLRLVQVDRRPPAARPISRVHVRLSRRR